MTLGLFQSRSGHKMAVRFREIEMLCWLEPEERKELLKIVRLLRDSRYKHSVNSGEFAAKLDLLREYCLQNDASDWKRCLVCGVCWVDDLLAINNRRLGLLAERSKSTLNSTFAKMGLRNVPINRTNSRQLVDQIPYLADHPNELRQGTYRATLDQFLKMEGIQEYTKQVEPVYDDTVDLFEDLIEDW